MRLEHTAFAFPGLEGLGLGSSFAFPGAEVVKRAANALERVH